MLACCYSTCGGIDSIADASSPVWHKFVVKAGECHETQGGDQTAVNLSPFVRLDSADSSEAAATSARLC